MKYKVSVCDKMPQVRIIILMNNVNAHLPANFRNKYKKKKRYQEKSNNKITTHFSLVSFLLYLPSSH